MQTYLYNPDQKDRKELISEFSVHGRIYEDIMDNLETSNMIYPEQNYVLVGRRGMGKTTLLLRLKYGIEDSSILKDKVIPILFTEEQYHISRLANLWEYVADYLEDYHSIPHVAEEMGKYATRNDFTEKTYDILASVLKQMNKKIILLIDNFGDLLNRLDIMEFRHLRAILHTESRIGIIGSATYSPIAFVDYHHPFFGFFNTIQLDELDKGETTQLLLQLGELQGKKEAITQIIKDSPARIETMRLLTGGVPRTISLLFDIYLDQKHDSALNDLYKILDLETPFYKYRMEDLPAQQQKIIDAMARHWEPISVKELTARTRLISKTLSAQLSQLEKDQIVVKNDTETKNKTYYIRDRLWNIWYLMRYGRKDEKQKLFWLVRFLESWLSIDNADFTTDMPGFVNTELPIDEESIDLIRNNLTLFTLGNNVQDLTQKELSIYLALILSHANKLITQGLYHSILKLLEEIPLTEEAGDLLKDQWKPLYLAIIYLYQPKELAKQPSELRIPAQSIADRLLSKESPPLPHPPPP